MAGPDDGKMRSRIAFAFVALMLATPRHASAAVEVNLTVVAAHDLGGRGMNAGLAIAGDCAFVGSRSSTRGTLILDIEEPAAPRVIGELPPLLGSTPREVRAVADLGLVIVLNYRLDADGPNTLDLYDVGEGCGLTPTGQFDFGEAMPHEFFLWRDPSTRRPDRLLAYVGMWGHAPNLRVIDLSDRVAPVEVAAWDAGPTTGIASRIHSVSVSPDGRRAYLADWNNGVMVLDTSGLARNRRNKEPVLLTSPEAWLWLSPGNVHSAVYVPGREFVVTTQEVYGPGTCPYGSLHVVDVADVAAPRLLGRYGIAENDPASCGATEGLDGAFTTHNPLVVGDLAFVSWYAGGLRVVDLADPSAPAEAGAFVPDPLPAVAADDVTLGSYPVRMWSYPIVRDGLIYVVDIRNGLYVLSYDGLGAEAIRETTFAEGNSTASTVARNAG